MNKKVSLVLSLATLAGIAVAGDGSTIVATAGSVAGSKSSDGTRWSPLVGSAKTATVSTNDTQPQDEFATDPSGPMGTTFQGSSPGSSNVSHPSTNSSAPTYYTATWATTSDSPADQPPPGATAGTTSGGTGDQPPTGATGGGTFDPWDVHDSDVRGLGLQSNEKADLYYQTGILANGYGVTQLKATKNKVGSYDLDVYIAEDGHIKRLLTVGRDSLGTPNLRLSLPSDFHLYLLGRNASDPDATPSDRIHAADAVEITGLAGLRQTLQAVTNPDGTIQHDLVFGIMRVGYQVKPSSDPDEVLFSWHTDSFAQSQTTLVRNQHPQSDNVDAMSVVAPLGIGALVLLRRRSRRS